MEGLLVVSLYYLVVHELIYALFAIRQSCSFRAVIVIVSAPEGMWGLGRMSVIMHNCCLSFQRNNVKCSCLLHASCRSLVSESRGVKQ